MSINLDDYVAKSASARRRKISVGCHNKKMLLTLIYHNIILYNRYYIRTGDNNIYPCVSHRRVTKISQRDYLRALLKYDIPIYYGECDADEQLVNIRYCPVFLDLSRIITITPPYLVLNQNICSSANVLNRMPLTSLFRILEREDEALYRLFKLILLNARIIYWVKNLNTT